ncbi:hypothetical protein IMG5_189690 [Ichthyophthirius multifiliis]|uniref:RRM domain-containing protein n=1 Tax=Ichthyophthirius multifiliis TaxID=5932 RepID=G0R448_ICHMU|nr:hypothetical protein IMG5_189690 [Ichthyophthirius multifiliis]EGR27768.1 hypothetical protein IMG5_189690 [Ichthyophthirius multifiliis]|eukprot:XP_004025220.1 hypothetical protein IMG5_189690 [Ichthyophthirius multifiliis]
MSLFIGNISRNVDQKTIENVFNSYGPCKIEFRHRYAFVQYAKDKDGEAAKNDLNNKEFGGLKLNVEWSKKSGRFDENHSVNKSRRSNSWKQRRDSPMYRRSASLSIHSDDCPRDKILKLKLKEQKQNKQSKKDKDSKKHSKKDNHRNDDNYI